MRSLVTGAAGFVGGWLLRALLDRGDEVYGFALEGSSPPGIGSGKRSALHWIRGDIRDSISIRRALDESRPAAVYHLAAVSFVPEASNDPVGAYDVNTLGVVRLLREMTLRLDHLPARPRVLVIGSGEQYGSHPRNQQPLRETMAQCPATIYAATKAAQEIVALQYARSSGIEVIATRSFNHSGPGQESNFLLPALVKRAKAVSRGESSTFVVGNSTPVRDFLHVADVVSAYIALMSAGESGESYNVSSAHGRSVEELIELVLKTANVQPPIRHDGSLARAVDVQFLVGDNTKLRQTTGWRPIHTVEDIVRELWSEA